MLIPYRTRCFFKRFGVLFLVIAIAAVAVLICWMAWLDRYVVYTRDRGAVLDFSRSAQSLTGQSAVAPKEREPVEIHTYDSTQESQDSKKLKQLAGYYITGKELETNFDEVKSQISLLPENTAVMMDVKSIYGNFFYSSQVSENRNSDLDIAAMDSLIAELNSGKYYTIARLPALRDRLYGLNNVNDGLPVAAGYLWMDDYGCYWLNPDKNGTISYLVSVANELKNLGFDEVVFCDYYFPETTSIVFQGDKAKSLAQAAQTIVNTCASDTFAVSFTMEQSFEAPRGRSRMYLPDAAAAQAETLANQFGFEDPQVRVVFLTDIHDTRFDKFSVLRPIADADVMD